jgi:hypothetical protein
MAYLYRHIRLDKNEPFYIGIGKNESNFERAYSKANRNKYWQNIVNQTEYRIDILLNDLTWEEVCEKEKEFIKLYSKNTQGGTLCNITDGGNGGFLGEEINIKRKKTLMGHYVSEVTKDKIRKKAIGRKTSDEVKSKMSLVHKSNKTGHWLESKGHKNGRAFKIYQYSLDEVFIKEWECAKYAIDFYGMNKTSITDCLKGRQKTANGFKWKLN